MKYLQLLRPHQWYKNLIIFIGLVFSQNLFNIDYLITTAIGFIVLCSISGANYIINDIIDLKKDKKHPVKKNRPLASGEINCFVFVFAYANIFFFFEKNLFFGCTDDKHEFCITSCCRCNHYKCQSIAMAHYFLFFCRSVFGAGKKKSRT